MGGMATMGRDQPPDQNASNEVSLLPEPVRQAPPVPVGKVCEDEGSTPFGRGPGGPTAPGQAPPGPVGKVSENGGSKPPRGGPGVSRSPGSSQRHQGEPNQSHLEG